MEELRDFTKGSIARHLIAFSAPMLIGNIFQQCYAMADAVVVGNVIGSGALASVGTAAPVLGFMTGVLMGLTTGASTLISQYFGAGRHEELRRTVSTSVIFLMGFIALVTLAGLVGTPLFLRLLSVPDDIFPQAVTYLRISFGGLAFMMAYNIYSAYLRALGDSRGPMFILIVSFILNIALDLLFIAAWGWGIAGAGWATVISQAVAGVACFLYAARKAPLLRIRRLEFDGTLFRHILRYSIPAAIQLSLTQLAGLTIQRLINGFGSVAIAGYTAASRVDSFAMMPLSSVSMAISTLVAQNMGAGDEGRAKRSLHISIAMMLGMGIVLSALAWVFGRPFIALFVEGTATEAEAILEIGTRYLSIIVSFYSLFALFFAFNGFFRGVGDAVVVMALTITSLTLRAVSAHLLAAFAGMGPEAVAWSIPIGWGLCSALAFIYYKKRLWAGRMVVKGGEEAKA